MCFCLAIRRNAGQWRAGMPTSFHFDRRLSSTPSLSASFCWLPIRSARSSIIWACCLVAGDANCLQGNGQAVRIRSERDATERLQFNALRG